MGYAFSYQGSLEGCARACATDLPISSKSSIMLAKFLRGKTVERARADLQGILAKKVAVPMTRFTEGAGHKPGRIAAGKYPYKAAKAFLMLIESAAANAEDQGYSENLRIISLLAQRGSNTPHQGRHRGRQRKVTHLEVVLKEETMKVSKKQSKKPSKKSAKKQTPKKSAEKSAKKQETKESPKKSAEKQKAKKSVEKKSAEKSAKESSSKKSEEKKPASKQETKQEATKKAAESKEVKEDGN